ncbi:MAG TPA: hypothetical protein V6D17_06260 [Candidatus Obscuribacterales bacterium]
MTAAGLCDEQAGAAKTYALACITAATYDGAIARPQYARSNYMESVLILAIFLLFVFGMTYLSRRK